MRPRHPPHYLPVSFLAPHLESFPDSCSPAADPIQVYGLYKQATVGDVEGGQPYKVQMEKRAKWDAWAATKGASREPDLAFYSAARL